MRIYVASSWRNIGQPLVVRALRNEGHEVYDFRAPDHPDGTAGGFSWSEIDPNWKAWEPDEFRRHLSHPLASHGFNRDFAAMKWADACVLVMPCGRSAHLELGWCAGAGKRTIVFLSDACEPELMWRLADHLCLDLPEVLRALGGAR